MEVWEEWKDEGFALLALSDESSSEIERFIAEFKATYPIGAGSRSGGAYGVQSYPSAYLIDHTGTVVWSGHPGGSEWVEMIPTLLAKAKEDGDAWDPGERGGALQRAVSAAKAGEMGKAWKESEALRPRAATDGGLAAEIDAFQRDFLARAATRTQRKDLYAADGRYHEATLFFERQMDVFAGSPPAEEWKLMLAEWRKDKTIKANADLDKKRLAALDKARAGERDKAIKELRSLKEKAAGLAVKKAIDAAYQQVGSQAAVTPAE